jgi:hypothetical protein
VKKKILIIMLVGILLSAALTSAYNAFAGQIETPSTENNEDLTAEIEPPINSLEEQSSNSLPYSTNSQEEQAQSNQTNELDVEKLSTVIKEPLTTETVPSEDELDSEEITSGYQGSQGNGKGYGNGNGTGNQYRYQKANGNKGNHELENEP